MKISSFSIILSFVVLSIAGAVLIPRLTVKLKPSQELPHIGVHFSMRSSSPRVIETEATSKLEAMLSRIEGVKNISSTSSRTSGYISIDFDKNTDLDAARFEVSNVIRQTKPFLPATVSYPSISQSRSDNEASRPFLTYTVNAPSSPILIQKYVESIIKPELSKIAGVAKVEVNGAMPMEWRLEYDHRQLEALGISAGSIQKSINEYLARGELGTARESETGEWVRIAFVPSVDYSDIDDFMQMKVPVSKGRTDTGTMSALPLQKLVTIKHQEEEPSGYSRINGLNSITINVTAEESANQLDLGSQCKNTMHRVSSQFPAGYETHLQYDATEYIDEELNKVYFRSGLTFIILLVLVLIIYRSFKYLLLIASSLIINLAVAVIFYYLGRMEIQLYSLAGITISLTLVIDNTIVMADQIIRRGNRAAYPAILAATLTTIASMVIIFFLDERIRLNLTDFAKVIIVNLAVSLTIALFLVPALIEKLKIIRKQRTNKKPATAKIIPSAIRKMVATVKNKINFNFNEFYSAFCRFAWRWKVPLCTVLVLAFGLPVYLIPDKIDGNTFWAESFNKTLGSQVYKEKIKPVTDVCLGGTMRLFAKKVSEGGRYNSFGGSGREETTIFIAGTLPNGSTLEQMNELVQKMESFISEYKSEIKLFTTSVQIRRASITIYFPKKNARSGFPYTLKNELIRRATELGGGSWSVQGLGDGFSNDVSESAGQYRINLYGYNYDELWQHAEAVEEKLLQHRRIKEVIINSQFSYYKDDYEEFIFKLNTPRMADENITASNLSSAASSMFQRPVMIGTIAGEYGDEKINLVSRRAEEYDIWSLKNNPGRASADREFKLGDLASIDRIQAPRNIVKENQQYRLCVQYDYIGSYEQGNNVLQKDIEEIQNRLPMGYSIVRAGQSWWSWNDGTSHQYWLLFLIFVIIYFMCSILFNSLKIPFTVIFVIPISFIGIFLTFYLFKLRFDEGGFASFILLCGLSVNANIYILNEYDNIRRKRPHIDPLAAYVKAWNHKISPIFLTVVSTVLGFIPFMIGERESFWFPLAAGTIGGLIMSLVGLFGFLPLFMGVGKKK
ncbi:MAG: efflux RND transporter permease subunit [Dysgonamonadaceae bacterium]|jgi:multidrug efflux pump subunit AcrB|nr:efflux RND transporter permease subunit [Dysgonamonadaceae bacterium]